MQDIDIDRTLMQTCICPTEWDHFLWLISTRFL